MSEPWADAVQNGLEDDVCAASTALARELTYLWSDLEDARRLALNGAWSIQCNWLTERIIWLTRTAGTPTPWGAIPCTMLLDGIYQGILRTAGIEFEEPDLEEVRALVSRNSPG
jgi:hypothetical protein